MTAPVLPPLADLVPPRLRPGHELLTEGAVMAREWQVGRNLFLNTAQVACEADYKRRTAAEGRIMQHAHIGFRSVERTLEAIRSVHESCAGHGVTVDRFGITLDWSMGYPLAERDKRPRGTGIVLTGPEDFARITGVVPAAAHFGDFMLGLPGAVENTRAALAAGVTTVGNLGQYFTFRLPDWDDDVATTEATVTALGLIAAQPVEVLVHSNLDDGFAGLFSDMSSALGMVLVEKYIVEELIGARASHCYGHHFTAPLVRLAFHHALMQVTDTPGSMIFGNTVSYKSTAAGNFASLASYLQADIWSLRRQHSGHAINPVPVTENERIPDTDEIIDAQTFAGKLVEHASASLGLIDLAPVDAMAAKLATGARQFRDRVLAGLAEIGVDIRDPAATMLALRRIGPRRLEALYGVGTLDRAAWGGRRALVEAEWVEELRHETEAWLSKVAAPVRAGIGRAGLKVCVASSDVHEHGKSLIEHLLTQLAAEPVDGGTSADPDDLVAIALANGCDVIAISTYNGIALRFATEVLAALERAGAKLPVCIGGRLNQIPEDSNSGLPVDVTDDLERLGVIPCSTPERLVEELSAFAGRR
ncbi:cobalamin-dependent protein [Bosea sp. WAO]|uniref:cobalamin-dependent protein n=1 Tax=Bosea sp. WAO TaxID=406341 RepID=UPI00082FB7A6|nr:cobalamin-dependent protein [Bosea sp. WAO]